jgi:hypothetical protein
MPPITSYLLPHTIYQLLFTSPISPAILPFLSPTLTVPAIFLIFAAPLHEKVTKNLKKGELAQIS